MHGRGWTVETASAQDLEWLLLSDEHIPQSTVRAKVSAGEYVVARTRSEPIGAMRFGLFWSAIPIVELIWVEEDHQREGVGSSLVRWLDDVARSKNCPIILSSSEDGETDAHAFHLGVGFRRAGVLEDMGHFQGVAEVFFVRDVSP